jgi:protein RecA
VGELSGKGQGIMLRRKKGLVKGKKTSDSRPLQDVVEDIEDAFTQETLVSEHTVPSPNFDVKNLVSTGSTLLDLNISGGRANYGGIPGGIIVELFGPPGAGKTGLVNEIAASVQLHGGDVLFLDPEGRLDLEYSRIYGVTLPKEKYEQPDTVSGVFKKIQEWEPEPKKEGAVNMIAIDSLAALSTEQELQKGDPYGMRRAKEFSEGLRKVTRIVNQNKWLIVCTNQERDSIGGNVTTPGGVAMKFYASLRIRIHPPMQNKYIVKKAKVNGRDIERPIGIRSLATIKKSSLDDPFRKCDIAIVFGYGIDDVRENLQFLKETRGLDGYWTGPGKKDVKAMDKAITLIDQDPKRKQLILQLRKEVAEEWHKIAKQFEGVRRPKVRV